MIERFAIKSFEYLDGGRDMAADARVKYKSLFPGRSARRMTNLGMMVGACLQKMDIRREVPIVYASEYGESESLERFIDSFPQASPALFQSSIHPSAVEQALIPGAQAIDRFYPITSDSNLFGHALENCFLLAEDEIALAGGDERGTWLCDFSLACSKSFAFAMSLCRDGEGIGSIEIDKGERPDAAKPMAFQDAARALGRREPLRFPSFAMNACMRIVWK